MWALVQLQPGARNLIGRFGYKARIPSLDDFTADAFAGDMGMTSSMRPQEPANPDGLTDDDKPGIDVDDETVRKVAAYVRTIEIPTRGVPLKDGPGAKLFEQVLCAACHVPELRMRAAHPLSQFAGRMAPIYSDLLLHEMGDELADGQTDESARPGEFRTAPLIALRFQKTFMHDGRAKTVEDAVVAHKGKGSQANESIRKFEALSPSDRRALLLFVQAL